MARCFCCEVFFFFLMIQKSLETISSYKCTKGWIETNCKLSNIKQTSLLKHFTVIPHRDVKEVSRVLFVASKMETLTEDVCNALPYVQVFDAWHLELTSVDENAFQKCTKLTKVNLHENLLTTLPSGLFDSNVDLSDVWLHKNKLKKIDGYMFKNNPNLWEINLSFNKIQEFSFPTEMTPLKKLRMLNLTYNALSDFNVGMLLEKCPNLKRIYFDENKFTCVRQPTVIKALQDKNIEYQIGKCTKIEFQHFNSDFIVIMGIVSIVVSWILGFCIGWLLEKFWIRNCESFESEEDLDGDYYYGY